MAAGLTHLAHHRLGFAGIVVRDVPPRCQAVARARGRARPGKVAADVGGAWRSSSLKAFRSTRCAALHGAERITATGWGRCRQTHQPVGLAAVDRETRRPARCAAAVITSMRLPATSIWLPTAGPELQHRICSALGRRVKSGQITPLKIARARCLPASRAAHAPGSAAAVRPPVARASRCRPAGRWPTWSGGVADEDVVDARQRLSEVANPRRCRRR